MLVSNSRRFLGATARFCLIIVFGAIFKGPVALAASVSGSLAVPVQWLPAAEHNRAPRRPNVLVLHYTAVSLEDVFEFYQQGHVSAHYTVDRNGDVYQHVDELEAAHHAGASFWRRGSVNQSSLGVEIVNGGYLAPCDDSVDHNHPAHCSGGMVWEPFEEAQIQQVILLCQGILERYAIDPFDVVGHADVAPQRKEDPGPLFPWLRLAQAGIGVGYDARAGVLVHGDETFVVTAVEHLPLGAIQQQLAGLGYAVPQHGQRDAQTSGVILAFNSHYLGRFDDTLSAESRSVLSALWTWQRLRHTTALLSQPTRQSMDDLLVHNE
jgi:N-acetylmuramoyl-L-alanine amidase